MLRSRAFATGVLSDVSEAELFVKYIGSDTISDLVTNVCREILAQYTEEQCDLHGVQSSRVLSLGPVWNVATSDWEARSHNLPLYNGAPIILVPKFTVRRSLTLNSQEFYNHYMSEFLKQEAHLYKHLKMARHMSQKRLSKRFILKLKMTLRALYSEHPEVLEHYKNIKGSEGPLNNEDLAWIVKSDNFDEAAFAEALQTRLQEIPTGNRSANDYHNLAMGITTFLFYPWLSVPIKEHEIHQGRKRVDIKYNNSAIFGILSPNASKRVN